jgi:hemoglobin-like flavoprotein
MQHNRTHHQIIRNGSTMNPNQITLVQESFAMVAPIAEVAAGLFYNRLFELDSNLRPLFKETDMKEQGKKLMGMLAMVVNGLSRLDELEPAVATLGRRHVDYYVRPEDYRTVGTALLWTLEQGLGDAFTPEVKDAWSAAYGVLATVMQGAHAQTVAAYGDAEEPAAAV